MAKKGKPKQQENQPQVNNTQKEQFTEEVKVKAFNNLDEGLIKALKREEFYLQKGCDALGNLKNITNVTAWIGKKYEDLKKNFDKTPLKEINTFVAYCDPKAADKDNLNEYQDNRVMAQTDATSIYQPAWIKNLLQYIANNKDLDKVSAYGVKKAIQYFEKPADYLPIVNKRHRELISKYFLGEESSECDSDLIKCFDEYFKNHQTVSGIKLQENKNYLYGQIIYALGKEWNPDACFEETCELLEKCKNLILTGAPGTGKTYLAKEKIAKLKDDNQSNIFAYSQFVQFHPTYDYTDFVEGLRPKDQKENIVFERKDGIFKRFCKCAILGLDVNATDKQISDKEKEYNPNSQDNKSKKYLFIIDEINRGDISKIFGELFFAIDPGYRGEKGKVRTQYQNLVPDNDIFKDGFYVPDNVYIVGTMNDIDRSVESLDFAFRRRFAFKEISVEDTQYAILNSILNSIFSNSKIKKAEDLISKLTFKMNAVNKKLKEFGLSEAYYIGAAYFKKIEDYSSKKFENLWKYHLKGVLYEYFRGEPDADKNLQDLKTAYDKA